VNEGEQFDIRLTVEEFKHSVHAYTLRKTGMDIRVSHVKRRNIPPYVFPGGVPGGVRPSCPAKLTTEDKQSSKLRAFGPGQVEKPQGGKGVAVGADDMKKRRKSEDDMDNNSKNSKSPVSLPAPSREVYEDPTPIKLDESEVKGIDGQKSKKLCLRSPGETPYGDSETNGFVTTNQLVNPIIAATDTSSSKEEENLAIEKIMYDPYDARQSFPEEPEELEDDTQYRNQVKDTGGNIKNNITESLVPKSAVAEEPVVYMKTTCSTRLCSCEGLEELEVSLLLCLKIQRNWLDSSIKYAAIVNCRYKISLACYFLYRSCSKVSPICIRTDLLDLFSDSALCSTYACTMPGSCCSLLYFYITIF